MQYLTLFKRFELKPDPDCCAPEENQQELMNWFFYSLAFENETKKVTPFSSTSPPRHHLATTSPPRHLATTSPPRHLGTTPPRHLATTSPPRHLCSRSVVKGSIWPVAPISNLERNKGKNTHMFSRKPKERRVGVGTWREGLAEAVESACGRSSFYVLRTQANNLKIIILQK